MDTQICKVCNGKKTEEAAQYCCVCGSIFESARRQQEMKYFTIPLNEYGKALVCPHCENEELSQGVYCKICGNEIVNRCSDTADTKKKGIVVRSCGNILQGNARYCSKCGNESTFFQKGWLKDWRSENTKKAILNINSVDNTIPFKDIQGEGKAE